MASTTIYTLAFENRILEQITANDHRNVSNKHYDFIPISLKYLGPVCRRFGPQNLRHTVGRNFHYFISACKHVTADCQPFVYGAAIFIRAGCDIRAVKMTTGVKLRRDNGGNATEFRWRREGGVGVYQVTRCRGIPNEISFERNFQPNL